MHEPTAPLRDRQEGAVRASWTAWPQAFARAFAVTVRPRSFVIGALAGLLLAYLAPFGSDQAPAIQRYVYWPGVVLGGTFIGLVVSCAVDATIDREGRRPILTAGVSAAVMTPPTALFVLLVTHAMFGPQLYAYPVLLAPVFLLSLAMAGLNELAQRRSASGPAPVPSPEPGASPEPPRPTVRFLDRLPPKLRGADLYAVEAEDHYLRLHTSRGSDLILMRLADAMVELEGLDGAQTHRSWWVARAAVAEARRGDGRAVLVLSSGVEAPVSRSFAAGLRARGWF